MSLAAILWLSCGGTRPEAAETPASSMGGTKPIPICVASDSAAVERGRQLANPCSELFQSLGEEDLDCAERAVAAAQRHAMKPEARAAAEEKHWATVIPGRSCEQVGRGFQISDDKSAADFTQANNTISQDVQYSCGCPNAPVFTVVYEPKTVPLRVRLCKDERADRCLDSCDGPESWDLTAALKDANTEEIVFTAPPAPCTCEPGEIDPEVAGGGPDWWCVNWCACKDNPDGESCAEL